MSKKNKKQEYLVMAQRGYTVQLRKCVREYDIEPEEDDILSKHNGVNHQTWTIVKVFNEHEELVLKGIVCLISFVRLQRLLTFNISTKA